MSIPRTEEDGPEPEADGSNRLEPDRDTDWEIVQDSEEFTRDNL